MKNPVTWLRWTGYVEGISYLALLGVAMPLKYVWGDPRAVSVVGMAHGVLWMVYVLGAFLMAVRWRWGLGVMVEVFVGSMLPLGPFFLHKRVSAKEAEWEQGRMAGAPVTERA